MSILFKSTIVDEHSPNKEDKKRTDIIEYHKIYKRKHKDKRKFPKRGRKTKANIIPKNKFNSETIENQVKIKYLYKPFISLPDLTEYEGKIIELKIYSEFLSIQNKAYLENRIWGNDIYTSNSDAVLILQHSGYFFIKTYCPTAIKGVSLYLLVCKQKPNYSSYQKNGIKSSKITNYEGHGIKPVGISLFDSNDSPDILREMASRMPLLTESERKKPKSTKLSDAMYYSDYNMIFNLSFEMWMAYSLSAISDKGSKCEEYTSWRLKKQVLYIETETKRYEIALNMLDHNDDTFLFDEFESFSFSEVILPFDKNNNFMSKVNIPLDVKYVKLIYQRVDWHDFKWGESFLIIKEMLISNLKCFNFYNRK